MKMNKDVQKILSKFEKTGKQLVNAMNLLAKLELTNEITRKRKPRGKSVKKLTQVKASPKKRGRRSTKMTKVSKESAQLSA